MGMVSKLLKVFSFYKYLHKKLIVEQVQARSNKNATNRAKLKMLHHIGTKPIREIIYQKGGKDGNPPDLATIFFETRKKDNKLERLYFFKG
ncbi:hypothetical protein KY290_036603 [Solanum tuberosum]|uniref:Uncharacterized protein n=1 Tax=Solanum tuberosum TaxID=4113 RepID=A0ABQ7TV55_SOLTU|nr:hypothetical protein KY289_036089 [Solanum tuberosum]KAH0639340.1 hypothetical protein KY285_035926 [Solanum tuberosum]KAH0737898.1 hypothetical protein KY290_036603 [Solanum tuberosum]